MTTLADTPARGPLPQDTQKAHTGAKSSAGLAEDQARSLRLSEIRSGSPPQDSEVSM